MTSRLRILLADDHTLFLEGLRCLLQTDFQVVGMAFNGLDLIDEAEKLEPDVILLDISMPLLNGLDAALQLRKRGVRAKLLFVTMHSGADCVKAAFRAGATGYILKGATRAELVNAVHEVGRGNLYLTPLISGVAIPTLTDPKQSTTSLASGEITLRQREVLQLIAEGHAAKAAAGLLGISRKTVEYHKARMMEQLSLRTSAELIRYAVSHGLVDKR